MNSEPKNMPIEASDREMDSVMLGIESRTILVVSTYDNNNNKSTKQKG